MDENTLEAEFRIVMAEQGYDLDEIVSLAKVTSDEQKMLAVKHMSFAQKSPYTMISSPGSSGSSPTISDIGTSTSRSPLSPGLELSEEDERAHKIIDRFMDVGDSSNMTLQQLRELLDVLSQHEDDHYTYFLEKKEGMAQIHRCVCALLTPYSSSNVTSDTSKWSDTQAQIQYTLVRIVSVLLESVRGVQKFVDQRDAIKSLVLGLSSPTAAVVTKAEILKIIASLNSPKGSWLTLEAFNHFKLVNRENVRFEYLAYSMGTACAVDSNKNFVKKDGEQFIIEAVGFFNSLLYMLKDDLSTRTSLQKELIAARIPDIVEKAKNLGTDGRLQIRAEQFLLEIADETYYRKLENVNELVVAVESKLQGLPSQSNFAHIIRMLNTLAEETVLHETAFEDWRIIDTMISRAIAKDEKKSAMDASINEIRLQDRITVMQKQITKLERGQKDTVERMKRILANYGSSAIESCTSPKTPMRGDYDERAEILQKVSDIVQSLENKLRDLADKSDRMTDRLTKLRDSGVDIGDVFDPPKPEVPTIILEPVDGPPAPPPPPPPMMAPPPPPPMPGANSKSEIQFLTSKKPMRNIYWNAINNRDAKSTIFSTGDITKKAASLEIDVAQLEELFGKQELNSKPNTPRNELKPQIVTLLEPKRAQHVAIIIKQFKMTPDEMKRAIISMDNAKFGESDIAFLRQVVPTADELEKVRSYSGDVSLLSEADQFHLEMNELCDDLAARLEAWEFVNHFDEISGTLRADTETVIAAADELTSRGNSFHDVLSIILALGNFLNGSRRQALGFRIDSLSKLADLKTTAGNNPDSVENLLEYMVQYISKMENANKLLHFGMHLSSVLAASRVDPARLNRDMQTLTQGLKKIEKLKIRRFNSEDKFQEVIRKFIIEAGDAMETIEQRLEAMAHGIRSVAELYGEEEDKLVDKYDTFFTEIANFVNAFQKAKDNLESKMKRRKRKQSVGKALKLNFDPVVPTIAVETLE